MTEKDISGRQKAAILLVTLGAEISAEVLKRMSEDQIENLTFEIASLNKIPLEVVDVVLREFFQMAVAQQYMASGGMDYAKKVLEKALGNSKAFDIINKLTSSLKTSPFDFIRNIGPEQVLSFIENEHPQTIALIISHLRPDQAAYVLSSLPQELQPEVAMRIALMDGTSPGVVKDVKSILEKKVMTLGSKEVTEAGGIKSLVDILNNVDRATEKSILERFEQENPNIAEEVKKQLFVFEDITILDDRTIQLILRDIDSKELALALKVASDEVKERIFRNMSTRAATMLQEDMEFLGPVRLRNVEEAQQRIVSVIRKLEESGDIIISRGREDELIV